MPKKYSKEECLVKNWVNNNNIYIFFIHFNYYSIGLLYDMKNYEMLEGAIRFDLHGSILF